MALWVVTPMLKEGGPRRVLKARELAQRFDHARELGEGRWVARCPVHDRGQNLYITDGDSGKTLMYCQSGCDNVEILKKVGLTWRDLFSGDAPKNLTTLSRIITLYFSIARASPTAKRT